MFPDIVLDVYMFCFGDRQMINLLLPRPAELNHHPWNSSQNGEWGCRTKTIIVSLGIIPAKAMLKFLLQYYSILTVQFFEQTGDFSYLQAILQSQGQKQC